METNVNQNAEQNNEIKKTGDFWHSSWAFFVFFIAIIGIMIAISFVVKRLM